MKAIIISLLLLGVALLILPVDFNLESSKKTTITEDYQHRFKNFQAQVTQLEILAKGQPTQEDLQLQITEARLAFKRIEYLFDYYNTFQNHYYINGGPVPKFDDHDKQELIPPNGLQTLDEIIYGDDPLKSLAEIRALTTQLKDRIDMLQSRILRTEVEPRFVIEALRSGIVRVITLGLTGFDTPGSVNAIEENITSMKVMREAFEKLSISTNAKGTITYKSLRNRYKQGIKLLERTPDFESINRMVYLREIANPIYKELLAFAKENGIEHQQYKTHAQNYAAENITDEDFLNKEMYFAFSFQSLNKPESIALGKMLFYDPILSRDLKMSCATCHNPKLAFQDGLAKSPTNTPGVLTKRNTPTLIDAGYATRYFWDLREYNLEKQIAHVIKDSTEFNISFDEISERLRQNGTYVKLFEEAYGKIAKRPIYRRTISNAIAAYVNSLNSFDSPFDKYVEKATDDYPADAVAGFNLFMGKGACGTCHFAPAFNGLVPPWYDEIESEILGTTLGLDTLNPKMDPDMGRRKNGLRREDLDAFQHAFKTVSLRNVALTGPYMHNGTFNTLEEVMTFYNLGGGAGMGVDLDNQTLSPEPLGLSPKETGQIISFLKTLTDTTGLTDARVVLPDFEDREEWNERAVSY